MKPNDSGYLGPEAFQVRLTEGLLFLFGPAERFLGVREDPMRSGVSEKGGSFLLRILFPSGEPIVIITLIHDFPSSGPKPESRDKRTQIIPGSDPIRLSVSPGEYCRPKGYRFLFFTAKRTIDYLYNLARVIALSILLNINHVCLRPFRDNALEHSLYYINRACLSLDSDLGPFGNPRALTTKPFQIHCQVSWIPLGIFILCLSR